MITIVYWEELESEFDEEAGEVAAVDGDSEILTATEDLEDAITRIKKHQEETKGRDIQYMMTMWLDGEVFCHTLIAENTDVNNHREDIKKYVKSFMH